MTHRVFPMRRRPVENIRPRRRVWPFLGMLSVVTLAMAGVVSFVLPRGFGQTYDNLVLSKLGVAEIVRFLEASDHDKGLTDEQIASKYVLGEIPEDREPPARAYLEWKNMPPSEQRQLKVIWFREHYNSIGVEDVNKHVNVEYLKSRAAAEYRENPLEEAARIKGRADEAEKLMKGVGKAVKGGKRGKGAKAVKSAPKTKSPSDTGVVKRAGKQKKTVKKAPDASPAPKDDATSQSLKKPDPASKKSKGENGKKSAAKTPGKELPWYGLPNKMKNE